MSFPRYAKYKDSRVEWLGEVPEHWEVRRLGTIFRQVDEEGEDGLAILSVSIHDGVSDKELDEKEMDRKVSRSDDRSKYKKVQPSDLVYNMMRALQGGFGAVSVQGMVSPAYIVARPITDFSTSFVEQLLRTPQAVEEMRRYSQGVTHFRLRLYWEEFKAISVVIPPCEEQTLITAFLDRETAKIDWLVGEQRRLIELLKEKRRAVISHAVTKGLNPHASMRPSGIDWLGDVPKHWDLTPIGRLCDCVSYGFTNPMPTADDGPFMLTANDVDYGSVKYDTARRTSYETFRNDLTEKSRPKKDDVLITKDGTLGRVALHDGQEACINQSVALLRVKPTSILPHFLATCLLGGIYQERMIYDAGGTTIKHIYISRLAKMPVTYPSRSEQQAVLVFLREKLAEMDTQTAEAQRAIDLLQERRTALISAAVTGKIDVRGLVESEAA